MRPGSSSVTKSYGFTWELLVLIKEQTLKSAKMNRENMVGRALEEERLGQDTGRVRYLVSSLEPGHKSREGKWKGIIGPPWWEKG